jgi:hypothetical protein
MDEFRLTTLSPLAYFLDREKRRARARGLTGAGGGGLRLERSPDGKLLVNLPLSGMVADDVTMSVRQIRRRARNNVAACVSLPPRATMACKKLLSRIGPCIRTHRMPIVSMIRLCNKTRRGDSAFFRPSTCFWTKPSWGPKLKKPSERSHSINGKMYFSHKVPFVNC